MFVEKMGKITFYLDMYMYFRCLSQISNFLFYNFYRPYATLNPIFNFPLTGI